MTILLMSLLRDYGFSQWLMSFWDVVCVSFWLIKFNSNIYILIRWVVYHFFARISKLIHAAVFCFVLLLLLLWNVTLHLDSDHGAANAIGNFQIWESIFWYFIYSYIDLGEMAPWISNSRSLPYVWGYPLFIRLEGPQKNVC